MKTRPILRGGKPLLAWSLFAAILFCGAAAQTYTKQNARVLTSREQVTYDSGGTPTSVKVEVVLVQRLVNNADANDVKGDNDRVAIQYDMLDPAISSLPINGVSGRTYAQLAADLRTAHLTRANATGVQ